MRVRSAEFRQYVTNDARFKATSVFPANPSQPNSQRGLRDRAGQDPALTGSWVRCALGGGLIAAARAVRQRQHEARAAAGGAMAAEVAAHALGELAADRQAEPEAAPEPQPRPR